MSGHVQSAPLGMYGGCGGEKRAAILVPPDGGPGANIDIDSSVEMGRRHMGLSSRTDYNLFDGILEPPHALETEFLKHPEGVTCGSPFVLAFRAEPRYLRKFILPSLSLTGICFIGAACTSSMVCLCTRHVL